MSKRLEEELEEILRRAEDLPSDRKAPRARDRAGRRLGPLPAGLQNAVSPGKLFLASGSLLLAALVLRGIAPGAVGYFFWIGLTLFIAAYALFFVRADSSSMKPRWRGKPVDYGPHGPTIWDRLRNWMAR